MVTCHSDTGALRPTAIADLRFRPSVYGVIVRAGQLLVVHDVRGRYCFPGGGIEKGECMADALTRELWEETGMAITVGEVLHVTETFFYCSPLQEAWHAVLIFYRADTTQHAPDAAWDPTHPDAERWAWVPVNTLRVEQFHESLQPAARALRLVS
ncbi:NUDIX domain-containing protein [Candidatus Uhrbacteria bacterium]|nr:NUDIX domain-containing protein [Candidatus Uhrbacteria bacterium]